MQFKGIVFWKIVPQTAQTEARGQNQLLNSVLCSLKEGQIMSILRG